MEIDEAEICPNCDARLVAHDCKLRCPRCGYFEDCSSGGKA